MMLRGLQVVCLALLLAGSTQAVTVPADLPEIAVSTTPADPGPNDEFTLTLSGQWPDSCTPVALNVRVFPDDSIWIDLLLPGAETCDEPACAQVISAWEVNRSTGPIAAGLYDVFARAVSCNGTGSFEKIGTLQIGASNGGDGPVRKRFAPGDPVVLLQEGIAGFPELLFGQAGLVICCDTEACDVEILVHWSGFMGGKADGSQCAGDTSPLFPSGSAMWIDPETIIVGRPFSQCGVIRQGLEGCVYFDADDAGEFNVMSAGDIDLQIQEPGGIEYGDRVRLQGFLTTTPPAPGVIRICPQRDGDIFSPVLSACSPVRPSPRGCCPAGYQPGDRVTLLVDDPEGLDGEVATELSAGATGTVVCCDHSDPQFPIFVSWDNFEGGSDEDVWCDPPVLEYADTSGWWMRCGQIAPVDGAPTPTPKPDDGIVIVIGGNRVELDPDPDAENAFRGCTNVSLEANFRAQLSAEVSPEDGVGGDWDATVSPEIVGPGTATVRVCVTAEDINLAALPPGKDVAVASISIFAVPAL